MNYLEEITKISKNYNSDALDRFNDDMQSIEENSTIYASAKKAFDIAYSDYCSEYQKAYIEAYSAAYEQHKEQAYEQAIQAGQEAISERRAEFEAEREQMDEEDRLFLAQEMLDNGDIDLSELYDGWRCIDRSQLINEIAETLDGGYLDEFSIEADFDYSDIYNEAYSSALDNAMEDFEFEYDPEFEFTFDCAEYIEREKERVEEEEKENEKEEQQGKEYENDNHKKIMELAKELERRAGITLPPIIYSQEFSRAAYKNGKIHISDGLLTSLSSDEDRLSVIYHEYIHFSNDLHVEKVGGDKYSLELQNPPEFTFPATEEIVAFRKKEFLEMYDDISEEDLKELMSKQDFERDDKAYYNKYIPSNFSANEINAYEAQLQGHDENLYTLSPEMQK